MRKHGAVLVAGVFTGALVQTLSAMSLRVVSCFSVHQAKEIISSQDIELVFCDEALPDGTFRDLVAASRLSRKKPNVIVIFRVGEWAEYVEALELGAFEVVAYPLRPVDIEMAVVQGLRTSDSNPDCGTMTA